MPTTGKGFITLRDAMQRRDITEQNMISLVLNYAPLLENLPFDPTVDTGGAGNREKTNYLVGLPNAVIQRYYKGILPNKSKFTSRYDTTMDLTGLVELDYRLYQHTKQYAGIKAATDLLVQEYAPTAQAFAAQIEERFFYGNSLNNPSEFMGLTPRYNSLNEPVFGGQIIDARGSANDNTSIWFIRMGRRAVKGLYAQGGRPGLDAGDAYVADKQVRVNEGSQLSDQADASYQVIRQRFNWNVGLAVKDPLQVVRIANISKTDLDAGNINIVDLFIRAQHKLRDAGMNQEGTVGIYCTPDVFTYIDLYYAGQSNQTDFLRATSKTLDNDIVLSFRGAFPIYQTNGLLPFTEERVV